MKEKITFEVTYGSDETDRCKGCIYLKCNYDDCMYGPFCKGHNKPILAIVRVKEERNENEENELKILVDEFTFKEDEK